MKSQASDPVLPSTDDSVSSRHHTRPGVSRRSEKNDLEIKEVTSLHGLEKLEGDWWRLTSAKAPPFQTFTWNLAWYRYLLPESATPLLFVAKQGNETVAILPGYLRGKRIYLAGDEAGDYQDIIAENQSTANRALDAIFAHLQRTSPGSYFLFRKVSSLGFLHQYFAEEVEERSDMIAFRKAFAPCPYVSVAGGLESYLASLSEKRRQDMRRSLRRFDEAVFQVRLEMIRNFEIRVDDLESVATFHASFFRKGGTSPLENPALLAMLGEVSKDPEVGLQIGALEGNGEMLAMDIGFARGGRYYGYLTGFHPHYAKWAPGKCLLLKRIDAWVKEDSVTTIDFLSGDETYKTGFTHGDQYEVSSVHWMPNRIPSRARRAKLVAETVSRRVAKQAVAKIALPR